MKQKETNDVRFKPRETVTSSTRFHDPRLIPAESISNAEAILF